MPEPVCTPEPLIDAITSFLDHQHVAADGLRETLSRAITTADHEALAELRDRLTVSGTHWGYFPRDAMARRIHHLLADQLLPEQMRLEGTAHLDRLSGVPTVLVSNHLSYSDANIIEVLLHATSPALAERLTVVAGPKVYSNLTRKFSSLCFGTIKTPQSSGVSSGEAVMNAREVATAARRTIEIAQQRMLAGDVLLVFAEGTRSRTGGLQPMLTGVTRYFEVPDARVVPVGITGSEFLFPIGEGTLRPGPIVVRIGQPLQAEVLRARAGRDRRLIMDAVGVAIAQVLPAAYRGAYSDGDPTLDGARYVLDGSR